MNNTHCLRCMFVGGYFDIINITNISYIPGLINLFGILSLNSYLKQCNFFISNNILNRVESFYEIAVIGSESKLITGEITNYFSPNTIVVQSKAESDLPLFIDRFFEDETYIYVCQNKVCQRPETSIKLALDQVPYIN